MSHDDEEERAPNNPKGTKLQNNKSMFANKPKKQSPDTFEKAAAAANAQSLSYKERASDLSMKFKASLDDPTLVENKNIFQNDLELELIGKLAKLATDINNDDNEPEGSGSVGLIALLFRSFLIQRDKINQLEYNLSQTNKRLKLLEVDKPKSNE